MQRVISNYKNEKNIQFAIKQLENEPKLSAKDLAMRINQTFNKSWSEGTKRVTGGMIYRWGTELMWCLCEYSYKEELIVRNEIKLICT